MHPLLFLNPLFFAFGALALLVSPFGWMFLFVSAGTYAFGMYKKTKEHGQWTLGLFLTTFWLTHLASERAPTMPTYPCGRTQGVTEGVCEVFSTAGFPFPSLHYFPAGDEPYLRMWPLFFVNVLIYSVLSLVLVRLLPTRFTENKPVRAALLILGVLLTLIGEAVIMLRFD